MIRRFTSGPKPASRVSAITCSALGHPVVAGPQSEAHAVELGQVGRALAGQDQVVGRQRVDEVRAGHLDDLRAEQVEQADRLGESLLDARRVTLAAQFLDHADLQAADVAGAGGGDHVGHRCVDGGRVARVVAGDHLVQQGRVQHRTRTRPGLVEAGGQRHQAVAGGAAVGRLHPDRAGDRGRLPDGAAGVGADGQWSLVRGQRGRRPAARATRDAVQVPRVVGRPVRGVLGRGAHRELVHVGLAQDHDVRVEQALGDGRVVGRDPPLQDLRAAGGRRAGVGQHVLERQRHPGQRADGLTGRDLRIHRRRRGQRASTVDVQEGVDVAVHLRDPVQMGLGHLDRAELA